MSWSLPVAIIENHRPGSQRLVEEGQMVGYPLASLRSGFFLRSRYRSGYNWELNGNEEKTVAAARLQSQDSRFFSRMWLHIIISPRTLGGSGSEPQTLGKPYFLASPKTSLKLPEKTLKFPNARANKTRIGKKTGNCQMRGQRRIRMRPPWKILRKLRTRVQMINGRKWWRAM